MNRIRKVFLFILIVLLMLPNAVSAQGEVEEGVKKGKMSADLKQNTVPKKQSKEGKDQYQHPDDYPLIDNGKLVDVLIDSQYTAHSITFDRVSSYGKDFMDFSIIYTSDNPYYKDRYLDLEFYKESNGTMKSLGYVDFDTYGFNSLNLSAIIPKSFYSDQRYIYVRLGIYSDEYHSDTTLFKVKNPFFTETDEPSADGKYALISNESVDADVSQHTGSFTVNNDQYTLNKRMNLETYQLDMDIPFDTEKYADKKIQDKPLAKKSLNYAGDSKSFWVVDFRTDRDYQISAKMLYSGKKTNIWVHNNQITSADAKKLGEEFDQKIHPIVTENFAKESDVDRNGKINILCFDIQDGFSGYGGYIAGYFYGGDLYDIPTSNKSEVFYLDTYPLMGLGAAKDVSAGYETLAHEFQHMVNFNQNVFVEKGEPMDVWLNEGLSMAAEQIYS